MLDAPINVQRIQHPQLLQGVLKSFPLHCDAVCVGACMLDAILTCRQNDTGNFMSPAMDGWCD